MAGLPELFRRASEVVGATIHQIREDQWHGPTPCSEWDVEELVKHLVDESLWVKPLFDGKTIAEVGDAFDGDTLGGDPARAWDRAGEEARASVSEPGAMERIVHLSFGDFPGAEYANQLLLDLVIHDWDVRRAIGADTRLDPELVSYTLGWFRGQAEGYRRAGATAVEVPLPPDADEQSQLIAMSGRQP